MEARSLVRFRSETDLRACAQFHATGAPEQRLAAKADGLSLKLHIDKIWHYAIICSMTLDAHIIEHSAPPEPLGPDPLIARAERWLCMLAWLVDLGGWLTGGLAHQAAPGINEPKWSGPWIAFPARFDPSVVYERLCRAVRLAMALQLKIEAEIRALRAGKLPNWAAPAAAREPTRLGDKDEDNESEAPETEREAPELEAPELEAPELEAPERAEAAESAEAPESPENLVSDLDERFQENDKFYKLLDGPLKDAVAAICADLGLKPDWSQWTEDGFPPPRGDDVRTWSVFVAPEGGEVGSIPAPDVREPVWRLSWPRPRRPKPGWPFPEDATAIMRWEKGLPP